MKMPTRCGNNRASPASEEFEKVKESRKDVWEAQGRANPSPQRQSWNFSPARLVLEMLHLWQAQQENKIFGEKKGEKLIIYHLLDVFPQLPGREAEERTGKRFLQT